MKPMPFELHRPASLEAALALLAEHGSDARIMAGGQSLMPMMNLRLVSFAHLIDLNSVAGLSGVSMVGNRLRLGAMTRQQSLLSEPLVKQHAPLLNQALPHIGHLQTRSRGTVGGSIAHADPSAELPLIMVTLDAHLILTGANGTRTLPARDFFEDVLMTNIDTGEVLTAVELPVAPRGVRTSFREYARRHGDFAIAACAVQHDPASGTWHIGLGGLNPVPTWCGELCAALGGGTPSATALARLIDDTVQSLQPLSDVQADADYRRTLARVLLTDCINEVRA